MAVVSAHTSGATRASAATADFSSDRWTLCFVDPKIEAGFLASRQAKLKTNARAICMVLIAYVCLIFLMRALSAGWSTNNGVFVESDEAAIVATRRSWVIAALGLVCLLGVLAGAPSRASHPGAGLFESLIAAVITSVALLFFLQEPWYLARLCGFSDPARLVVDPKLEETSILFVVDVWLSAVHLLLPIRWARLWPAELLGAFGYPLLAGALGSPLRGSQVVANVGLMICLVGISAMGKRALESFERTAFVLVATERTLRAEAEHKLTSTSSAIAAGSGRARQEGTEIDTTSTPATTNTGKLFSISHGDKLEVVQEHLQELMQLGALEHWLVQPHDLEPIPERFCDGGNFGVVMLALYQGAEVVLKASRTSCESMHSSALPTICGELRIFRRLRHPNVVLFYGACVDAASSEIVLVLEYVQGKPLRDVVQGVPSDWAEAVLRCRLANDVCCALAYLHAQTPAVIHGDIKDTNILLEHFGSGFRAKMLDFGLSRLLTPRARYLGGTLEWMAPEVITQQPGSIAPAADVFSLGRLLFTIMTGRSPLQDASPNVIASWARVGAPLALAWPERMPCLSKEARELSEMCMQFHPASRPGITRARQVLHQWEIGGRPAGEAQLLGDVLAQGPGSARDVRAALQTARETISDRRSSSRADSMAQSLPMSFSQGSSLLMMEDGSVEEAGPLPQGPGHVSL